MHRKLDILWSHLLVESENKLIESESRKRVVEGWDCELKA